VKQTSAAAMANVILNVSRKVVKHARQKMPVDQIYNVAAVSVQLYAHQHLSNTNLEMHVHLMINVKQN